ncbi:uncharacterized protein LOC124342892 [Daphnia pulicaria]|uniref:uncharacterized protein LOC124342892 n=1 Tax=Daphnia pulicaria TaxID=35523 RepID=UPI001EECD276|nr:uncharacterized protein LOC124342892 [Daphnia pulicaria]XP_046652056.1 uncharacterized protein LOC124342892 [Daphnia pulicaria]XP_046652057.1 uncharacterized protein LOC124342892 [Daphnia pulicaria]XP_046652058.1 uncharacterized protein LOC124342892 [Daphnia pulicaria]
MGCADSKSAGLANPITTVAAASNGQQQHQPSSRDHSNFQTNVEDSAAGHCCLADEEDAAVKIQAFYRGYQTRRDLADKKEKELYGPGGKPGKKKKGTYPKPQAPTAPPPPPPQQQPAAAAADLQQQPITLT